MKTAVILILSTLLLGCAEFNATKSGIATYGAQAADAELEIAEWGVCQAVTMGAWQRRYGNNIDKINGWNNLCSHKFSVQGIQQ